MVVVHHIKAPSSKGKPSLPVIGRDGGVCSEVLRIIQDGGVKCAILPSGDPTSITPIDFKDLDFLKTDTDIQTWLLESMDIDIDSPVGIETFNKCLIHGAYIITHIYQRSFPNIKELSRVFQGSITNSDYDDLKQKGIIVDQHDLESSFLSFEIKNKPDIIRFIRFIQRKREEDRYIYFALLRNAIASSHIISNPILTEPSKYLKLFFHNYFGEGRAFREVKETGGKEDSLLSGKKAGYFSVILNGKERRIPFIMRYRTKKLTSIHRKGLALPQETNFSLVSDLLGFEFEMSGFSQEQEKENMLFLFHHLYRHLILDNYSTEVKTDIHSLQHHLKKNLGFSMRQKGMFSDRDIESFLQKYSLDLDANFRTLLREGFSDKRKKTNAENYSDAKLVGRFEKLTRKGVDPISLELRVALKNNTNNDGLSHHSIRDIYLLLLAQERSGLPINDNTLFEIVARTFNTIQYPVITATQEEVIAYIRGKFIYDKHTECYSSFFQRERLGAFSNYTK